MDENDNYIVDENGNYIVFFDTDIVDDTLIRFTKEDTLHNIIIIQSSAKNDGD